MVLQTQAPAVSAALGEWPKQKQTAQATSTAPKPLVALVEWAEPLPSADAAALAAALSPMPMRLQPQQAAMAESVARSAAWVALVDLVQPSVAETASMALPEQTAERLAH